MTSRSSGRALDRETSLESGQEFWYRRKPTRVEAIQWRSGLSELQVPHWFAAVVGGPMYPSSVHAIQIGASLQVTTKSGTVVAREDDWIVRTRAGEISVETAEQFNLLYGRDTQAAKLRSWRGDNKA